MSADPKVPPDDELVEFFGVRPTFSDDDSSVPSYYQELAFKTRRGDYLVVCRIQASCGDLELSILRDSVEIVSLEVSSIVEYRIEREADTSALVATFSEASGIRPLVLRLAPVPHVQWGTCMGFADRPRM